MKPQTLVARGIYRIDSNRPDGVQVFQLHPAAWHFAPGHVPKLELLGQDAPYARISNGTFSIGASDLQLRLPVHEVPCAPGTPPVVGSPKPPVRSSPHPVTGCVAYPASAIARKAARASAHGIRVSGSSGERPCPHAGAATRRREHVARVYVSVYKTARGGRCRFLQRSGKLTAARSCTRPVEFLARGTKQWTLRLSMQVPRGRYLVRSDAVDGLHRHQRRSPTSVIGIMVQ